MDPKALVNTYTIPSAFRAWQKKTGYQGGAGAGLHPLCPVEGESVSDEKPASRDIPWRQYNQETGVTIEVGPRPGGGKRSLALLG
jgi:hypothetical protein